MIALLMQHTVCVWGSLDPSARIQLPLSVAVKKKLKWKKLLSNKTTSLTFQCDYLPISWVFLWACLQAVIMWLSSGMWGREKPWSRWRTCTLTSSSASAGTATAASSAPPARTRKSGSSTRARRRSLRWVLANMQIVFMDFIVVSEWRGLTCFSGFCADVFSWLS